MLIDSSNDSERQDGVMVSFQHGTSGILSIGWNERIFRG